MKRATLAGLALRAFVIALFAPAAHAETLDPREIVRRAEDALQGETAEMTAAMTITTPRWTRVVRFHTWGERLGDRSFIRILDPRKDRGTGFLRLERSFWTYLPRVERIMRIPPSMMLQPWMGSDFTNDDLVRESSMVDDYEAEMIGEDEIDGAAALGVRLTPHEAAPVVWGRVDLWVEKEQFAPLLYEYYDEPEDGRFELLRRMTFSDIRQVSGRPFPHTWEVVPLDKEGHSTLIVIEQIQFDEPLSDSIFSQKNLRRAEGAR